MMGVEGSSGWPIVWRSRWGLTVSRRAVSDDGGVLEACRYSLVEKAGPSANSSWGN